MHLRLLRLCGSLQAVSHQLQRHNSKLSYVHHASPNRLEAITIGHELERTVEKNPDATACVFMKTNIRKSMKQLFEDVEQTAAGLVSLKLARGDRVGVWSSNQYEWLLMQFATARTGIIMVNLNPLYLTEELAYALHKTECKALVAGTKFRSIDYLPILRKIFPNADSATPSTIQSAMVPSLQKLVIMSKHRQLQAAYTFDELMTMGVGKDRAAVRDLQYRLGIDDPINIQFTSGTTGKPKGVTLSHFSITNASRNFAIRMGFDKYNARICCSPPFYHIFGMLAANMQIATTAATVVVPSEWFNSETTLEAVHKEKCSALYGTPTMLMDVIYNPRFSKYDTSSLRSVLIGGAPCLPSFLRDVKSKMQIKDLRVGYALTESLSVAMTTADATEDQIFNTVGSIRMHIETKLIDSVGRIVPRGQPGEVCIRSYANMLGYWNDEKATKETIDSGRWLHTGDIGILRDDDHLQIVGRAKEMVIRGGENIYPVEVEDAIKKHDAIADVQVVGVPDKRMGEEVCAIIILKRDVKVSEEQLRTWLAERIAKFKIPKYFKFVSKYPMTPTGKVQKFKLRDETIKTLKLD